MTPSYIVIGTDNNGCLFDLEFGIPNQKKALEIAEQETKKYGRPSFVYECIARIDMPKPEPIVTMRGD